MIIRDIIIKSFSSKIDIVEMQLLEQWLAESDENRDTYIKLKQIHTLETVCNHSATDEELAIIADVNKNIINKIRGYKVRALAVKFAAAIAVVSLIVFYGVDILKETLPGDMQVGVVQEKVTPVDRIQHQAILVHQNQEITLNNNMPQIKVGSIYIDNNSQQNGVKLSTLTSSIEQYSTQETRVIVPRGCRYSVALPDSSVVWLNAESQISFPAQFNARERVVTLVGEAYFDVAKDKKRPFIVNFNKDKQVEVIGTRFNIRSYDDEKNSLVTLNQGSVKVITEKGSVVIAANEQIDILPDSTMVCYKISNDDYMSWISGHIQYRNVEFITILNDLSRRYNIDFVFSKKELKYMKLTILLTREVALDEIIMSLNRVGENIFNTYIDKDTGRVFVSKI